MKTIDQIKQELRDIIELSDKATPGPWIPSERGCSETIRREWEVTMNKKLRVLVACEYSGAVRDSFIALGHDAMSCDLLPTDIPGPHHTGDVAELLSQQWDILIAFPPCTYLCSSGMHWTVRGLRDPKLTEDALEFVRSLMGANVPHIALENPVGAISTRIRKPDCVVHPWQYGHQHPAKAGKRKVGKPNAKRTEQTRAKQGPMEGTEQDIQGHCASDGGTVERVRIVFAHELPECECCGEPWCPVHLEHWSMRTEPSTD